MNKETESLVNAPTREEWLNNAVRLLKPLFAGKGAKLPEKLRVTCGWPSSGGCKSKGRTIGQCWSPTASEDGTTEIFSSPYLNGPLHITEGDCMGVLPTLVHELVHASVGTEEGHKGPFKTLARGVGLEGRLTATHAGPELLARLTALLPALGDFPHARLDLTKGPTKKQTCRQVKCTCGDCGYTVRTTRKWLDERGAPICPCNQKTMSYEIPKELEEESEDEGGEE